MTTSTKQLRRRIVRHSAIGFSIKSQSRDDGTQYHPHFDGETGEYWCDCPDHTYRYRACKHIQRAIALLERNGEIKGGRP